MTKPFYTPFTLLPGFLVWCLILLGSNQPTHAVLIAYEGFDYSSGTALNGLNGGSGFSSGWVEQANANVDITSPGQNYSNLVVSGNAATVAPVGATDHSTRLLSSSIGSGSLFISILINPIVLVSSTFVGMGLYDTTLSPTVTRAFFGKNSNLTNWSLSAVGAPATPSSTVVTQNTLNLLVLRIDFNASGVNERIRLYLNPDPLSAEPLSAAIDVITIGNLGSINKIGFGTGNTSSAIMDEIRLGTTWNDVVPLSAIPEPTTALLLLTGLGALLLRKHLQSEKMGFAIGSGTK